MADPSFALPVDAGVLRLTPTDLASQTVMVLRSGKKKYAVLKFE